MPDKPIAFGVFPSHPARPSLRASIANFEAKVALIGPADSRACGLATFTRDILQNAGEHTSVHAFDHVAILRDAEVIDAGLQIIESDQNSYRECARTLNNAQYDAVWIQHEFGIFGGIDGEWVLDFAERLAAPLIVTFHTILANPSPNQARIVQRLVALASRIMVMSENGRATLVRKYGASLDRIALIEHGAPDRPFSNQSAKDGHPVTLATFGLIGPGKGLETALEALAIIKRSHSDIRYRILGATHPVVMAKDGEAYREKLEQQIARLGLADNIEWVNRFLSIDELLGELGQCQIYLTPYPNLQQSTSGTLSYAVALGKAVVSTPYLHAQELLADECGLIFPVGDSQALAESICDLLDNPSKLAALQQRAYLRGRRTIWPEFIKNVDAMITQTVIQPSQSLRPERKRSVPGMAGFFAMIDGTGMLQHSKGLIPDRDHGYCLDDNVRALMLMNLVGDVSDAHHYRVMLTLCSFIQHCHNSDNGRLRNFMAFDRTWLEDEGSEDSNGRAIWCFGHCARFAQLPEIRKWGRDWFLRSADLAATFGSPRAIAFAALGAALICESEPANAVARTVLENAGKVLFKLLKSSTRPDWAWFETVVGYDNPRLPEALLRAGHLIGDKLWVDAGADALRWINTLQTSERGLFRPVGSDSFGKDYDVLPYDQQPLEAWSAIDACATGNEIAPSPEWNHHARLAMNWFHGGNDRGIALADIATGTCRDGITRQGVNENRGAESIVAFQLAYHGSMRLAGHNEWDVANDEQWGQHVRELAQHSRPQTDRRPAAGGASPFSFELAR